MVPQLTVSKRNGMPTLNWIGKEAVLNHHREMPYHLLRCDENDIELDTAEEVV